MSSSVLESASISLVESENKYFHFELGFSAPGTCPSSDPTSSAEVWLCLCWSWWVVGGEEDGHNTLTRAREVKLRVGFTIIKVAEK